MRRSDLGMKAPANDNSAPTSGQGDLFGVRDINVGQVAIGEPVPHLVGHVDGMVAVDEIMRRGGDVPAGMVR